MVKRVKNENIILSCIELIRWQIDKVHEIQVEVKTATNMKGHEVKLSAGTSPTALSSLALDRRFYLQRLVMK